MPRPILLEAVQAVSRRMFEIIEPRRRIQLEEAAPHPLEEVSRETLGAVALKDVPSLLALPTKDHGESLPHAACSETCYISQAFVARFATLRIRYGEAACVRLQHDGRVRLLEDMKAIEALRYMDSGPWVMSELDVTERTLRFVRDHG